MSASPQVTEAHALAPRVRAQRLPSIVIGIAMLTLVLGMSATPLQAEAKGAEASSYIDLELHSGLMQSALLLEWLASAPVSEAAALVGLDGDSSYRSVHADLLGRLAALAERQALVDSRRTQTAEIRADLQILRDLPEGPITEEQIERLETIGSERSFREVSLEPLAVAESHMLSLRDEIVEASNSSEAVDDALPGAALDLTAHLEGVQALLDRADAATEALATAVSAERLLVVEAFPEIHQQRLRQSTVVGGMGTIAFDAYVRGSAGLGPSCVVDWALLAGIGRVESNHGTFDETVVSTTGRVSPAIFGPLLDGGATEREEALAQALAAAEEEALRLAEEEAAIAAFEASIFNTSLYGEELVVEVRENYEREQAAVEDLARERDRLLWGADLPAQAEPDDVDDPESQDAEDAEEPEGNGFAVIEDTDDGRFDENDRWDRAVGPMQFIPETWQRWAIDGDGDGVVDPQNLYDAAATAGAFLCHLSRANGPSPSVFVLGYNSSSSYVRSVLAFADEYRSSELPTAAS